MTLTGARLRRDRGERGAVAVEAALVLPLLVALVFGMIEMAFLVRDHASVASLVRTGVRVASTGAGDGPGTCDTSQGAPPCTSESSPALAQLAADAVQRAGSAMPTNQIRFLLVYRANDAGMPGTLTASSPMPTTCNGIPACVRFVWRPAQNQFRYDSGSWTSWRISACFPGTTANPLDRVGIFVAAEHRMMTGLFGAAVPVSDRAVMNFEPLPTGSCKATGVTNGGHW